MTAQPVPSDTELLAKAIDRLAGAIEQGVLAFIVDRKPADPFGPGPLAELDELPPVHRPTLVAPVAAPAAVAAPVAAPVAVVAAPGGVCPVHNTPWKVVPAGISKKTGREYAAFSACSVAGCNQRPPR